MKHISFYARGAVLLFLCVMGMSLSRPSYAVDVVFNGNTHLDRYFFNSVNLFIDQTTAASNSTTKDVFLGSINQGEATYYGMQSPFGRVVYRIGSWGTGNGSLKYEYSGQLSLANPDGFSDLTLTSNPNSDFKTPSQNDLTEMTFTPPSDWVKRTINGVNAYWIKVTTMTPYALPPKADEIKIDAYNLKVKVEREFDGGYDGKIIPSLGDDCVSGEESIYRGEWAVGNGIRYYALRTDGGQCTLSFYYSIAGTRASFTASNLTTTLQDLTSTPVVLKKSLKVLVKDEVGNVITDAVVAPNGGNVSLPVSGQYYYFQALTPLSLQISKVGYVTESGLVGNTGLAQIQAGPDKETIVSLTAPTNQSCLSIVGGSTTNTCAALRLDTEMTVKTAAGGTLAGATVTYYQDSGYSQVADDLSKKGQTADALGTTDAEGKVKTALATGTYYYKVTASGYQMATGSTMITSGSLNTPSVTMTVSGSGQQPPPSGNNCAYTVGSLVKLPDDGKASTQEDSAVYYYGKDCKRHAFPNDKVYFTWYSDFNSVTVVNAQTLASMTLGANVTYRPGVKMVKFTTVDKVYAVAHGGVLRWVKTEDAAKTLYGSTWNKKIDDISDAFFVNYTFGTDINTANDYSVSMEMQNAITIDQNL